MERLGRDVSTTPDDPSRGLPNQRMMDRRLMDRRLTASPFSLPCIRSTHATTQHRRGLPIQAAFSFLHLLHTRNEQRMSLLLQTKRIGEQRGIGFLIAVAVVAPRPTQAKTRHTIDAACRFKPRLLFRILYNVHNTQENLLWLIHVSYMLVCRTFID